MSTAKPGLTVPSYTPPDSTPKTAPRSRKQRSGNSSNSNHPKKLEKSPSFNSNLNNGVNNNPIAGTSTGASTSVNNNSANSNTNTNNTNNNNNNNNNNGNSVGNQRGGNSNGRNNSGGRRDNPVASENDSESSTVTASTTTTTTTSTTKTATERSRGYLANRPSSNRLDQDSSSSSRRDHGSGRPPGSGGRLFDPKKDPVPVAPPASTPKQQSQGRSSGPGDTRNLNSSSRKRSSGSGGSGQQNPRLYDPNQAQPQSVRHIDNSGASPAAAVSKQSLVATSASNATTTPSKSSSSSNLASPMDGLVKLTKEIQQLEKKVMERPSRRTLDSDQDDIESSSSRQSGSLTWNRRIDNSKRLATKYLKLMQLDFKSSLKHDIDTRCWKLAIYPLIETFRAALRNSEHVTDPGSGGQSFSESDEDHMDNIRHYFAEFIGFAQEFYDTLKTTLQKLEAKHGTPNSGGVAPSRTLHIPRWHRCIGILGDLARYRWLHKLVDDGDDMSPPTDWLVVARRLYREAIDLGPGNGKMYNQLALLSGGRGLESLYYYSKSLTVRSSFMNARDTLTSFFAANEQIRSLQALSLLKQKPSKVRQANGALEDSTLKDCEGSFLLLHAMLFEKINLDHFEKRLKNFSKQLKFLHAPHGSNMDDQDLQQLQQQLAGPERWDGFYFMLAVINIAGVYEYNWSSSVIAKSNTAFGSLTDHLVTVATLPYSSRLLLSTMEQSMQRYMASVGQFSQKVLSSSLEEQQGWLVYCHVVLVWMASRPFGSSKGHRDMTANWQMMVDETALPTFWTTLVEFMNWHWNRMTPFDQSDMLSAFSEEMVETTATELDNQEQQTPEKTVYKLSLPPLGHEWELRGLAWLPTSRFGSRMFKGSQPALDDAELKGDSLWKQESLKAEHLSKRLVELSLIAAMHMEIIAFDFCENAFKISDEYAAHLEHLATQPQHSSNSNNPNKYFFNTTTSTEEYSTDDNFMSSSHASISQDSGLEEDEATLFSSDGGLDCYSTAEIMELKSKRDQLKSLLNESAAANANSRQKVVSLGSLQWDYRTRQPSSPLGGSGAYGGNGYGRNTKGGGGGSGGRYNKMDRRSQASGSSSHHRAGALVTDNSTLVIDTNCLVADWTLVQRLVSADRWTVIIPLAVITELDGLKNNPAPLGPAAAGALTYLEGCLAMRPKPRRLKIQTSRGNYLNDLSFRVESFNYEKQMPSQQHSYHKRVSSGGGGGYDEKDEEDYDGDEEIMRNHNVDDFILGLCLWHQENGSTLMTMSSQTGEAGSSNNSKGGIYLVTDDRNLRVKARARSVEVLGKDDIGWMTSQR